MTTKMRHRLAQETSASLSGHHLTAFLRRFLAGAIIDGEPTIARAAEAVDFNVRTLQRRLEETGVTYHQLVNEVRLEMAIVMLVRSEKTVAEISRALGYSHPGHFTRAFKRWTGQAPSAVRKRFCEGCKRG